MSLLHGVLYSSLAHSASCFTDLIGNRQKSATSKSSAGLASRQIEQDGGPIEDVTRIGGPLNKCVHFP